MAQQSKDSRLIPSASQGKGGSKIDQIRNKLETSMPEEAKQQYQVIITAAERVLFDESTKDVLVESAGAVAESDNPAVEVAEQTIAVMRLVVSEIKSGIPVGVYAAAAMSVTLHILAFMEKSGKVDVTDQLIADAAESTVMASMDELGISPDDINSGGQQQAPQQGQQPPPQQAPQPAPQGRGGSLIQQAQQQPVGAGGRV